LVQATSVQSPIMTLRTPACQHVDDTAWLHQITAQHDLSSDIDVTTNANTRRAFALSCLGATFACVVFAWASSGGWTGGRGNVGAFVVEMLAGSSDVNSIALVGKPLRCCARGSGGKPGVCLLGDPNGICCGSELALLCGAGSLCYTNGLGHPYCCGKHTSGCAHVCLDNFTRDNFISSGGVCNPVSPQGFNADGAILYVDAPWDGKRLSYQLDGTHNITYIDPPIRLGVGDFTMSATVIPRRDSIFGFRDFDGLQYAALFRRLGRSPSNALTGYVMGLTQSLGNVLFIELYQNFIESDRRLQNGRRLQTGEDSSVVWFNLSVPILANVSISLRVVRQGLNLSGYVDNMLANRVAFSSALSMQDVDTDLTAPLEISPRNPFDEGRVDLQERTDFPGSIRDLRIASAAEFP